MAGKRIRPVPGGPMAVPELHPPSAGPVMMDGLEALVAFAGVLSPA